MREAGRAGESGGKAGQLYDLLIVGGGVNGAAIARDAAGRGLSVLLVEQGDLAGATSSASSKLVHGGLRYLEHYEFRLVREALAEREVLLGIAPHIVWPLTFVLPHDPAVRSRLAVRAGLFLYDHLAPRSSLPGSRGLDLRTDALGAALQPAFTHGFAYADCWVDDARLVVLTALDAHERGATILTRTRFVRATPDRGAWTATLDGPGGEASTVRARVIVNAAGPWVDRVLQGFGGDRPTHVRLVKGSHIVVPRLYAGEHAFILQNADRRVVFVIPYERDFTLIGTTDVAYAGDPGAVAISAEETGYLCDAASRFLRRAVTPAEMVRSFSGVRPLHGDDAAADLSAVTRDYVLEVEAGPGRPPLLSIFGGKITTHRRLAEHALAKLRPFLPGMAAAWTADAALPGGDLAGRERDPAAAFERFLRETRAAHPWLPPKLAHRLARAYGARIARVLDGARSMADLGRDLGAGLSEREVAYLREVEWAQTADDILWRRTKLGLHGGPALADALGRYLGGGEAISGSSAARSASGT